MSQIIAKTDSKTVEWAEFRRFKVGQSANHLGQTWTNTTGSNGEPGISDDWTAATSPSAVVSTKEVFTATAAQTDFVLSTSPNNVDVIIDRVIQIQTIDYNFSVNKVVMTVGVDLNSKVEIRKF